MKLRSIELVDFRPFYGSHDIKFSTNPDKPITLFVGENGHGKTTIMNAIHWALTDKFTGAFSNPDDLINKDALRENRRECSVKLEFEDTDGREIRIIRKKSENYKRSELSILEIAKTGEAQPVRGDASVYLSRFFPKTLAQWFIFDGEAIKKTKLDGSTQFKSELQRALGFDSLVTLRDDLSDLIRKYEKIEIKNNKNDDLDRIETLIDQNEQIRDANIAAIQGIDVEITDLRTHISSYADELSKHENSKDIQNERSKASAELDLIRERLRSKIELRNRLIGESASALMLSSAITSLDASFIESNEKQSIPSPYSDRLVDDILAKKKCICGNDVLQGSEEAKKILALKEFAGTSLLNHRISQVRSKMTRLKITSNSFFQRWNDISKDIDNLEVSQAEQKQIYDSCTERLNKSETETIKTIERKHQAAVTALIKATTTKTQLVSTQENAIRTIERLTSEKNALLNVLTRDKEISRKISKLCILRDRVISEFERQEREVLNVISLELCETIRRCFTKNYKVQVDEKNYSVRVLDIDGIEVNLSEGEQAVVSLAFMATMVGMAANKTHIASVNWISEPVVSPLVLDAPFAPLDPDYRKSTALNLSQQVRQLILLSHREPLPGLLETLESKIGKLYLIEFHAKGNSKEEVRKRVTINGESHYINFFDGERDESQIRELTI